MNQHDHIKPYIKNCDLPEGAILPEGMHRYALILEYKGSTFQGFQRQDNTPRTIQAYLEHALSVVADRPVAVSCAGRTDSGVHASRQVIHFDVDVVRPTKAWVQGVNTKLPNEIRVHSAREVPASFHSRFTALARTYRYVIFSGQVRPTFIGDLVSWFKYPFNVDAMATSAQYLIGELDFSSFRATHCQSNSPFRCVEYIKFREQGPFIVMEIKANAFLHHMVRNIMGSLIDVGRGAKPVEWIKEVLDKRDRRAASDTAPPHGLFLVGVDYPPEYDFPSEVYGPEFLEFTRWVDPNT